MPEQPVVYVHTVIGRADRGHGIGQAPIAASQQSKRTQRGQIAESSEHTEARLLSGISESINRK